MAFKDDEALLLQTDSDISMSPEHKSPVEKGIAYPLKVLQPTEETKESEAETASRSRGTRAAPKPVSSGSNLVITGVETGESNTEIVECNQSRRTSKINALAESAFGVSTKQAVAEAESTVNSIFYIILDLTS